jgi:hypothetical protein
MGVRFGAEGRPAAIGRQFVGRRSSHSPTSVRRNIDLRFGWQNVPANASVAIQRTKRGESPKRDCTQAAEESGSTRSEACCAADLAQASRCQDGKHPGMPCLLSCTLHFVASDRCSGAVVVQYSSRLSVSIVLTQPSCRLVIQPCMESSASALALRSLPALEVIGSDSDLVARSDLGCALGLAPEHSWRCRIARSGAAM